MKNKRQPIKQAIKSFYASKHLSDTQYQDLQALQKKRQQSQSIRHSRKPLMSFWTASIAASLLFFTVTFSYMQPPMLITAAYADTIKDADLHNGMQEKTHQWMDEYGIGNVPEKYRVEMSKFCKLNQYPASHLRIAGAEQGILHIFLHQGHRPMHWLNRTGTVNELNWSLIKVRDDLTLIVMHSNDMREAAIQHILAEMLPDLKYYTFNQHQLITAT